jgi:hypothetical protein
MKKLLFTITIASIVLTISCQKETIKEKFISSNNQSTSAPLPGNYCKGCGEADNPLFGCVLSGLDMETGGWLWLCTMRNPTDGSCPVVHINDYANLFSIDDSITYSDSYNLRDSMSTYNKTQDYITYAYVMGYVMTEFNTVNSSNIVAHLTLANKIKDATNTLFHGLDTEIPVDTTLRNEALDLISYYRGLNISSGLNDILDIFEADINYFTGATSSQILDEI